MVLPIPPYSKISLWKNFSQDLERFWPIWIAFLENQPGNDADARLREAIRLSQGIMGLEKLARSQGNQRPRAYLDWFFVIEGVVRLMDQAKIH